MLEKLTVNGFRVLVGMDISFDPLTIMIGRNAAGKTSILDSLRVLGDFARGGPERAFGPPPWSLSWQRSRGFGNMDSLRLEANVSVSGGEQYEYVLALGESGGKAVVREERLMRSSDHSLVASFHHHRPPKTGTILSPEPNDPHVDEVRRIAEVFRSVIGYELNPAEIERGNDPNFDYARVGRDGFGVAGYLDRIKTDDPERFGRLESRLKRFRPETRSIETWPGGNLVFWGLKDYESERAFPAVHLSWGDRQLVGLLCVLYSTHPGATIAIEEIDRGFHPSRYSEIIELLSQTAYEGLDGREKFQIVITTHSPSFLNRLQVQDRLGEIRVVSRAPGGGTHVKRLKELLVERLGSEALDQPLGEAWEQGLLDDLLKEAGV